MLLLGACGGGDEVSGDGNDQGAGAGNRPAEYLQTPAQPASNSASIDSLDHAFVGPAFASDEAAVQALVSAFQDADQSSMQAAWSRMRPAQKLAANEEIRQWMSGLEDDELQRVEDAYRLLKQVDWAAVHSEAEVMKATAGLEFGNLRGVVLDPESNEPVVGMTINARHVEHGMGVEMFSSTTQDETDAAGGFELTHIPTGEILLVGLQAHYILENATAEILADQTVERTYQARPLNNRLRIQVMLAGEVTDAETGEPVMSATVFLENRRHRTRANGRYGFDTQPGTYTVRVEHRDYHTASAQVTLPESGALRRDFALQPITTGIITGIAVDRETGEILANATIQVGDQTVTTDAQGRFRITDIESGDVSVRAMSDGYRVAAETVALAARTTAETRLELEAITTGNITGVVMDAGTRAPLSEARVSAGGAATATDADGRFELLDVPIGKTSVLADKAVYEQASIAASVLPGGSTEVTLALAPITYGSVTIKVVDASTGQPLSDSVVQLGGERTVRTGTDGLVLVERVPAGERTVTTTHALYRDASEFVVVQPADIVELVVVLQPIVVGTVTGIAVDAVTQAPLAGVTLVLGEVQARTGADGRFELVEVAKGKRLLQARKPVFREASQEIEVLPAQTQEVRIELTPIVTGTITGRVVNEATSAPLADAMVRVGDRTTTTTATGEFVFTDVPAGDIGITASKAVFEDDNAEVLVVAAESTDLILALQPITTGSVTGRVINAATGAPLVGVEISIGGQSTSTKADGSYLIQQVPAGEWGLGAQLRLFEPGTVRAIVRAAGTASIDMELTPITYGTLEGTVRDAVSGQTIGGARIQIAGHAASSDASGRFSIERIPAGTVNLVVSKSLFEGHQSSLEIEPAQQRTVTVDLQPITYGTVVGEVIDADTRTPLAGAVVEVAGRKLTSDESGQFRLERVSAGDLLVNAAAPKYQPGSQRTTLAAGGEASLTIPLTPIKVGRVAGIVTDAKTGQPIAGVRISLRGETRESGADGAFEFVEVLAGAQAVTARHADYSDGSATGQLEPAETLNLTIRLDLRREDVTQLEESLATRGTIDLYGIHFDSGKDQFNASSITTLNAVLTVMQRAPDRHFRVSGHTDSDGSEAANQNLSERRARRVIEWLVDQGVERERLSSAGYGERQPAAPNDSESGKALNRRVELSYAGD